MTRILFVCHGNICRSPMAEFVMKDLVRKAGLEAQYHIESAATSTEEIGNPVYPPARRKLAEHGIDCAGKTARQLANADYDQFDLLIGMDQANLRNMHRICGGDFAGKLHLLMDYTDHPGDVADPWYTDDFETTWRDVLAGCEGLLRAVTGERLCCFSNEKSKRLRSMTKPGRFLSSAPAFAPGSRWRGSRILSAGNSMS